MAPHSFNTFIKNEYRGTSSGKLRQGSLTSTCELDRCEYFPRRTSPFGFTRGAEGRSAAQAMTPTDFQLAQQRIAARRQLRDSSAQQQHQKQRRRATSGAGSSNGRDSGSGRLGSRLAYPLRRIGSASAVTWSKVRGREGTRPGFRVGQVDAELLDEELLDLLKAQVGDALKLFGVRPTSPSLLSLPFLSLSVRFLFPFYPFFVTLKFLKTPNRGIYVACAGKLKGTLQSAKNQLSHFLYFFFFSSSLTSAKTGPPKSCLRCAWRCSNSPYGTMTLRTAPPCRTCASPTPDRGKRRAPPPPPPHLPFPLLPSAPLAALAASAVAAVAVAAAQQRQWQWQRRRRRRNGKRACTACSPWAAATPGQSGRAG